MSFIDPNPREKATTGAVMQGAGGALMSAGAIAGATPVGWVMMGVGALTSLGGMLLGMDGAKDQAKAAQEAQIKQIAKQKALGLAENYRNGAAAQKASAAGLSKLLWHERQGKLDFGSVAEKNTTFELQADKPDLKKERSKVAKAVFLGGVSNRSHGTPQVNSGTVS